MNPCWQVGDHVERIDGVSLVGSRHYEVARRLKEIPVGTTFTLRAVEPLKAGFGQYGRPESVVTGQSRISCSCSVKTSCR